MSNKLSKKVVFSSLLGLGILVLISPTVFAAGGMNLSGVAENLQKSVETLVTIIKAGAYLAGVGFLVGGIMKFKQHKDNPTQVTIGQPVALLVIAGALLFMPTLIDVAGDALFGDKAKASFEKK